MRSVLLAAATVIALTCEVRADDSIINKALQTDINTAYLCGVKDFAQYLSGPLPAELENLSCENIPESLRSQTRAASRQLMDVITTLAKKAGAAILKAADDAKLSPEQRKAFADALPPDFK